MNTPIPKNSPEPHLHLLGVLYQALTKIRVQGLMSFQRDIDVPDNSPIFGPAEGPRLDPVILTFMRDILRMMVGGNLNVEELDCHMECYRATTDLEGNQVSQFNCVRYTLRAALNGYAPQHALELGRQGIPSVLKPSFEEMENYIQSIDKSPVPSKEAIDAQREAFFDSIGAAKSIGGVG